MHPLDRFSSGGEFERLGTPIEPDKVRSELAELNVSN
jgi:hypothetical protein